MRAEVGRGVWAPNASEVDVVVDGARQPLTPTDGGWFTLEERLPAGTRYAFSLDGGEPLPDPRSHRQPEGVFGPSEVVDHAGRRWGDGAWRGFHLPSSVLYELHVGTFTAEGTFAAAIERIPHLVELGVGAIEVMPVAAFDGERGWGYDGVHLSAPHEPYGGPAGLSALVDAAHAAGLGVVLDVVWNHLGPTGNRLADFGPYFTDRTATPWGHAVNLDGPGSDEVRAFLLESARHWFLHHHVDALRLDAVHELHDESATHLLAELATATQAWSAHAGRPLWLIAESNRNDPATTRPVEVGGHGMHAQWADDLHHAVHVALTGEQDGYYADYAGVADIAMAWERGFVYDGRWSPVRKRRVGGSSEGMPRDRLVVCAQNHDQVGNRARGERLVHLCGVDAAKVAAALVLLAPGVPLMLMGEEWGASSPFPYFVGERGDELDEAVRRGRLEEFVAFGWQPDEVLDPVDPATMAAAVLRWDELGNEPHAGLLDWHRALLELRRSEPDLTDPTPGAASGTADGQAVRLCRGAIEVVAHLEESAAKVTVPPATRELLLASRDGCAVGADAVRLEGLSVVVSRLLGSHGEEQPCATP